MSSLSIVDSTNLLECCLFDAGLDPFSSGLGVSENARLPVSFALAAHVTLSMSDQKLENVFCLGGAPCAGKSSISNILASSFNLDLYHVDEAFEVHAQRFDPTLHPTLTKWRASSWNERWTQPIDNLIQDVIACYQEHFTLILEDVLSLPKRKALLVEGTALLPRQVGSVLPEQTHAVWVVPAAGFQREHYSKREWVSGILQQCDNSAAAFNNWMERDARFARWITAEVNALGLELLRVDGRQTIEEMAMMIASHFQLPQK